MSKKRKSGEGMLRKRSDGRWEARVVIGYDENNLPRTKNVTAVNKDKCLEKLEKLKSEIQDKRLGINLFNAENTLLMEENEHIKQTIKDMINTERTELGKMTLRHLWRQIQ